MKLVVSKTSLSLSLMGVLIAISITTYGVHNYLNSPIISNQTVLQKMVTIPKGSHFSDVVQILLKNQLLDTPLKFKWLAYSRNAIDSIKAGEYVVQTKWTPNQLLDYLVAGKSQLYKVTIPEGLTFNEIIHRITEKGLGKRDQFQQLNKNLELRKMVNISPMLPSLEGVLFPETYYFSKIESEFNILSTMIKQFNKSYSNMYRERSKELGLTEYEVLILASIVEKETGRSSDRNLISAVFHNRLKKKMRLQTDPTVIYGIKNFDGNITSRHLKTPTPYNTYINYGLPPSPISNPGKESIEATLYPADVNYLYFVARGDGTSQFSTNLKAHNRAVIHYQKNRKHRKK